MLTYITIVVVVVVVVIAVVVVMVVVVVAVDFSSALSGLNVGKILLMWKYIVLIVGQTQWFNAYGYFIMDKNCMLLSLLYKQNKIPWISPSVNSQA